MKELTIKEKSAIYKFATDVSELAKKAGLFPDEKTYRPEGITISEHFGTIELKFLTKEAYEEKMKKEEESQIEVAS